MVEGPKVWLKKERLIVLRMLRLLHVDWKTAIGSQAHGDSIANCSVNDVLCVGKELFITFDNAYMLRFHFGMNGSERIMSAATKNPPPLPKYQRKVLSAVLFFDQKTVFFYDTSIQIRCMRSSNIEFSQYLTRQLSLDIMSPTFDVQNVLSLLQRDNRPLVNSLLDQNIVPGVGNIIKCEGLFRARLNPGEITCNVSTDRLLVLIRHLKAFSWSWYHATRGGRDITKQVYGRDDCSICGKRIKLVRHSGEQQRITYYCVICQPLLQSPCAPSLAFNDQHQSPQTALPVTHSIVANKTLPSSDSSHSRAVDCDISRASTWLCGFCNYRHVRYDCSSTVTPRCDFCEMPLKSSTLHRTRSETRGLSNPLSTSTTKNEDRLSLQYSSTSEPPTNTANLENSEQNGLHTNSKADGEEEEGEGDGEVLELLPVPLCPNCRAPADLQRVRKAGPTQHRLFWTCSSSRSNNGKRRRDSSDQQLANPADKHTKGGKKAARAPCSFFAWADTRFPRCDQARSFPTTSASTISRSSSSSTSSSCHVQQQSHPVTYASSATGENTAATHYTILRRVLKEGANNGRYFFACAARACVFFQWAATTCEPAAPEASPQARCRDDGVDNINVSVDNGMNNKVPEGNTMDRYLLHVKKRPCADSPEQQQPPKRLRLRIPL